MATTHPAFPSRQRPALAIRSMLRRNLIPYLFLAPSLLLLLLFVLYPLLQGFILSFYKWSIIGPPPAFIGLENYLKAPQDHLFWRALGNTLYYTLGAVPLNLLISLGLALLLNQPLAQRGMLRSAFFFPSIISSVMVAIIWTYMFDVRAGILNYLLQLVNLPPQKWVSDPVTAMPSIIAVSLWHSVGYNMVIFLAGLQGIPGALYEAAAIDGANRRQTFWRITLPLLRPILLFVLVTSIIGAFKVFDIVYVMTRGGPAYATVPIVQYIYFQAFESFNIGYASSLAYILFVIILVLTLLQLRAFWTDIEY